MKVKVVAIMSIIASICFQTIYAQTQMQVTDLGVEWAAPSCSNVGILEIQIGNVPDGVFLTTLKLQSGNTSDSDIAGVNVYKDNGDGIFNPEVDVLIAGGIPFTNSCAEFTGLSISPKDNGNLGVFIALDIADFPSTSNYNQADVYCNAGDIVLSNGGSNSTIENPAGSVTLIKQINVLMNPGTIFSNITGSRKTIGIYVEQISGMKGAHVICEYDTSKIEVQEVRKGSIWPGSGVFFENRLIDSSVEMDMSYLNGTVSGSGALAEIDFIVRKPGTAYLRLSTVDLRDNLNCTMPFTLEIVNSSSDFLLGDFRGGTADPDGKVDFEDLVVFASAFGKNSSDDGWDPVFDIGPTNTGGLTGIPDQDNVINFEDLSLFALNYGAETGAAHKDFDLMFKVDKNDGSNLDITLLVKRNSTNWDKLGSSNFSFTFNPDALENPALQTAWNFTGGNYTEMSLDYTEPDSISINVSQLTPNNGTLVTSGWMEAATVHFDIINPDTSSYFNWDIEHSTAFDDDETTHLYHGTLKDIYVSLAARITNPAVPPEQEKTDVPLYMSKAASESMEGSVCINLVRNDNTLSDDTTIGYDLMLDCNSVIVQGVKAVIEYDPALMRMAGFKKEKSDIKIFVDKLVDESAGTVNISWAVLGKAESICKHIKIGELYFEKLSKQNHSPKFCSTDVRNSENEQIGCVCKVSDSETDGSARMAPETVFLSSNYPNPFNPSTHFYIRLDKKMTVQVDVLNILGQRVTSLHTGLLEAGTHGFIWNGKDQHGEEMESGVYIYVLACDSHKKIRKMTLIR